MRTTAWLLATCALLAGCGEADESYNLRTEHRDLMAGNQAAETPSKPTGEPAPTGANRGSFSLNEVGARDLIDSLGPRWRDMIATGNQPDSFSGGQSLGFMAGDRSAAVHTLANGRVWNLQLRSGMADRCGSAAVLEPLLDPVLRKLAPSIALTGTQRATVTNGLKDQSIGDPVEIGGVRITGTGGCIVALEVRTISRNSE